MLQLVDRFRRVAAEIFDGVLVAQPVRSLDGVVHVPAPVVLAHIAERGGDAALRRDGVAAGGKDLGDAGGLQALRRAFQRGAQARAAGADDDDVESVIDDFIGGHGDFERTVRWSGDAEQGEDAGDGRWRCTKSGSAAAGRSSCPALWT